MYQIGVSGHERRRGIAHEMVKHVRVMTACIYETVRRCQRVIVLMTASWARLDSPEVNRSRRSGNALAMFADSVDVAYRVAVTSADVALTNEPGLRFWRRIGCHKVHGLQRIVDSNGLCHMLTVTSISSPGGATRCKSTALG